MYGLVNRKIIEIVEQIEQQKRKLYQKTQTLDAFFTLWDRFLELDDFIRILASLLNLLTNIDLQGLLGPYGIELPPMRWNVKFYMKAYYGISKYDESYYDPSVWQRAFMNLAMYVVQQCYNYVGIRHETTAISEAVGGYDAWYENMLGRIPLIMQLLINNLVCGFWILGLSRLSQLRKTPKGAITSGLFVTRDLKYIEVKARHLLEVVLAPICGHWVCGFNYVISEDPKKNRFIIPETYPEKIRQQVREQDIRFVYNLTGIKLLTWKPFYKEERVHTYAEKVINMHIVEHIVDNILRKYEVDPIKRMAYYDFARELLFGRYKSHRPAKRAFYLLSEDKFVNYLFEKYVKMGLDPNILKEIYNRLILYARNIWRRLPRKPLFF